MELELQNILNRDTLSSRQDQHPTGYEDAVEETARLTDSKVELTEDEKTLLDAKLRKLTAITILSIIISIVRFGWRNLGEESGVA